MERVTYILSIKQASPHCWELTTVINISGPSSKTMDSMKNRFSLPPPLLESELQEVPP